MLHDALPPQSASRCPGALARTRRPLPRSAAGYPVNGVLCPAQGVAAGCDNAAWEVWDVGCNQQVGRGKVKKGRCESIASCKSGRVLYMGWDNPEAGFLMMADTYTPANMKKVRRAASPPPTVKRRLLPPRSQCAARRSV